MENQMNTPLDGLSEDSLETGWNDPRAVFIRPELIEGQHVFAIYDGGNGDYLGFHEDRDGAMASAIQYGMHPASVH